MDITWEIGIASPECLLRTTDALVSMGPDSVTLVDPLTVPELTEVLQRFHDAEVDVVVRTDGRGMTAELANSLLRRTNRVEVTTASFPHAIQALRMLDAAGPGTATFGLDARRVRYAFERLEVFCTATAPGLTNLGFVLRNA